MADATDVGPESRIRAVPSAQGGVMRTWLHDHTLQALEYIAAGGYRDDADAEHLREVAARAADELRGELEGARRPARDLVTALADTVASAQVLAGPVQIYLSLSELERPLAVRHAEALAGAVAEALTNVRKHARARHVVVRCMETPDAVVVTVADDGRGFDAARTPLRMGLRESIAGRLAAIGGTAVIESHPDGGTRVTLHLPAVRRPDPIPEVARSAR